MMCRKLIMDRARIEETRAAKNPTSLSAGHVKAARVGGHGKVDCGVSSRMS
jgi:hypothetical protein